ncbi:flagellar hook assembly protein FlgD [Roseomonas stagni]|uniref:Basal-body rod modification protein FlgD n=1 Tax=Falsiroseomonas algicola TaxID=2716930 RepID=A0A6M1LLU6_9PROT|nr:flagellar hook assembly protein FlgD [Falsiroseomonas algicola]NGM21325.1 flagellar hook assembly protein FlgD [Falsiroseomonas algicola]
MSGSITATTSRTTSGTAATANSNRLSSDLNTFLRLLTTQLQNQDPTQPMDANQLTQQLVQFSTVEQQMNTNSTLQSLLSLQQAGQLGQAASLVGNRVTVASDRLPLQNGGATVNLPAAGAARSARIEIRDTTGNLVRSQTVALGTAAGSWQWDGKDTRGRQRDDGSYRLTVTGLASDGGRVDIDHTVTATVTGATRVDGAVTLKMGAVNVGYDAIRDIVATR